MDRQESRSSPYGTRDPSERGSLYPALHRLEKQGWVASEWKITENKQRAKYYRLTRAAKKQLAREESRWKRLVEAVTRVMRPV